MEIGMIGVCILAILAGALVLTTMGVLVYTCVYILIRSTRNAIRGECSITTNLMIIWCWLAVVGMACLLICVIQLLYSI